MNRGWERKNESYETYGAYGTYENNMVKDNKPNWANKGHGTYIIKYYGVLARGRVRKSSRDKVAKMEYMRHQ